MTKERTHGHEYLLRIDTPPGITTAEWEEAGLPFEGWLRYSQASDTKRKTVERLFRERTAKETSQ